MQIMQNMRKFELHSLCACAEIRFVDVADGGPELRLGIWLTLISILGETLLFIMNQSIDGDYYKRKPLQYLAMVTVWGASFAVTNGKLGLWSFGIFALSWFCGIFLNDLVIYGTTLMRAIEDALTISILFTLIAATCIFYSFVSSTIVDPIMELVVFGVAYPILSYAIQEFSYEFQSTAQDKLLKLGESSRLEKGTFLFVVPVVSGGLMLD